MPLFWGQPNVEKLKTKRDIRGLIKALNYQKAAAVESYQDVRKEAAQALGEIGDAQAVEPLLEALQDRSSKVCQAAVLALGQIGDPRAVETLVKALQNISSDFPLGERTEAAAKALGQIGDPQAMEPLVKALQDTSSDFRSGKRATEAAKALGLIGDPRAIEPLVKALQDRWIGVREKAAKALGQIGDRRAVEPLIFTLQNEQRFSEGSREVGVAAAQALGQIGDARAVGPLLAAFQEKDWRRPVHEVVREAAKQALVQLGAAAVESLAGILKNNDEQVTLRQGAVKVLGLIKDRRTVELVLAALKDPYSEVRSAAAEALGLTRDERAIEPLVEALKDKDRSVEAEASRTLASIGLASMPALLRELHDGDSHMKKTVLNVLNRMEGSAAAIALPHVIELLVEALKDRSVEAEASRALASIGLAAMPALLRELRDGDSHMKKTVLNVLGRMEGSAAAIALPHVIAFLSDPEVEVRGCAVDALRVMGPAAKEAVPFLIDRWGEVENPELVLKALVSIGKLEDPRVIDPLLKLLFAAPRKDVTLGIVKNIRTLLLAVVPFSPLTEELVNWIIQASTYEHKYRGYNYDAGYIALAASGEAVRHLCRVKSPVTSNVLHLIAQKKDIAVTMSTGCSPDWQETVSFQGQRDLALEELKRRGNPLYQPEGYLVTWGAEIEQLKRQVGTEQQREKAERYQLLLSLVRNPRTELGEDKWTYYKELARDFKTVEVFRLLANDLARYHYIQSYDLSRFESLLEEVGQKLGDREIRNALALVQTAWPQTAAGVIERIKRKKSQKS